MTRRDFRPPDEPNLPDIDDELTERQIRILSMRFSHGDHEGYTMAEIAERLGVSKKTVDRDYVAAEQIIQAFYRKHGFVTSRTLSWIAETYHKS
jgi:DNA-directed RNA polymerase specialized sigma24 family protein